jgi:DNA-binding MarR family transcriptional regulator
VPAPSITPETDAFGDAWEAFFRAARRARAAHPRDGLTVPQYHVLEPLLDGPAKAGAIAAKASIAAPTATRMLDLLAKQGLVERHASEEDRRCVLVALTEDGRRSVTEKRQEVQAMRRKLAGLLDETERAQATRLLLRLADALEEL